MTIQGIAGLVAILGAVAGTTYYVSGLEQRIARLEQAAVAGARLGNHSVRIPAGGNSASNASSSIVNNIQNSISSSNGPVNNSVVNNVDNRVVNGNNSINVGPGSVFGDFSIRGGNSSSSSGFVNTSGCESVLNDLREAINDGEVVRQAHLERLAKSLGCLSR